MRTAWSSEPETTRFPSCEMRRRLRHGVALERPETVWPVSASQMRTAWSSEPETTRFPSCENATEGTRISVALERTGDCLACLKHPRCGPRGHLSRRRLASHRARMRRRLRHWYGPRKDRRLSGLSQHPRCGPCCHLSRRRLSSHHARMRRRLRSWCGRP